MGHFRFIVQIRSLDPADTAYVLLPTPLPSVNAKLQQNLPSKYIPDRRTGFRIDLSDFQKRNRTLSSD